MRKSARQYQPAFANRSCQHLRAAWIQLWWAAALALWACPSAASGDPVALPDSLVIAIKRLAREAAAATLGGGVSPARVEVLLGRIDPNMKLAPCQRIEPYLLAGAPALGRSHIGLRCVQGDKPWQVSLPVTIQWWTASLVASTTLPAGTVLEARHLVLRDVDIAARAGRIIDEATSVIGRTLTQRLVAGEALRGNDLKPRHCFNAGDTVRILAAGPGYSVSSEGQALGPGLEGQSARARTESGRIVTGIATGERRIELTP